MDGLKVIAAVMAGGSLGAVCRYGVSRLAAIYVPGRFPWGTLAVNLLGCLLIGAVFTVAERTQVMGPATRLFVMTGILGAMTTFSTYSLETIVAVRSGSLMTAVLNILVNNVGGVALVLIGMWLTGYLLEGR